MSELTKDAPRPPLAGAAGLATGTEARVCQDIALRQRSGVAKYGFTVEDNPLHLISWLRHAYEECLDQAVYLRRAIEEIEKARDVLPPNAQAQPPGGAKGGSNAD